MSSVPSAPSNNIHHRSNVDDDGVNIEKNMKTINKKVRMPTAVFIIGMAGTGKTTLTQRINHYVLGDDQDDENDDDNIDDDDNDKKRTNKSNKSNPKLSSSQLPRRSYFINIDPAVIDVPFAANIDIRDTVSHKEVMKKFRLGPNGAIMTSLNIFATKINEVLALIEKRALDDDDGEEGGLDYVFIDTPGQIEVFTWSASGQMITEAFAATMPTTMLFIADTVRCVNPQTFMSTMLYSCSVMYKSQLPLCIVFNKCDATDGSRVTQWMEDSESFSLSLKSHNSFSATLSDSLSLFMGEYYRNIAHVSVSALEGNGMRDLFRAIDEAREKFISEYEPIIQKRMKVQEQVRIDRAKKDAEMLDQDAAQTKI